MLGAKELCIFCHERKCLRHQPGCDRCNAFCWICRSTKADENCGRCQRAARKLLASTEKSSKAKHLRLSAIVDGAESITRANANKLLKPSGVSEALISSAAGGGEAGTAAVKYAAVAFASFLHQKSEAGEDIQRYYVRASTSRLESRRKKPPVMPTPAAHEAVAQVGERRLVEPFNRDKPAVALAVVGELFLEASNGVTDPLVVADLNRAKEYVQSEVVRKVRNPRTHKHGWRKSAIEALEKSARADAEKAIKRVLGRSRAAVEERRAKEPPKKKVAETTYCQDPSRKLVRPTRMKT